MRYKLFIVFTLCVSSLFGKVYDCFTFFNELDLLKVRLEELYDVVDHFVIVESPISFTGKDKPLYYTENAHLFQKYKDKIIPIIIYDFPASTGDDLADHWRREEFSRNAIMNGLIDCKDDDIVLLSDLDEIPSENSIGEISNYLSKFKKARTFQKRNTSYCNKAVCSLDMRCFMYKLDLEANRWLHGSKAFPYWLLQVYTPWEIKILHHKYNDLHVVKNAGWHLNTMGGKEKALYKWLLTGPLFTSEAYFHEMEQNEALLKGSYETQIASNTVLVHLNDDYPKYILKNLEYFHQIGWFWTD